MARRTVLGVFGIPFVESVAAGNHTMDEFGDDGLVGGHGSEGSTMDGPVNSLCYLIGPSKSVLNPVLECWSLAVFYCKALQVACDGD